MVELYNHITPDDFKKFRKGKYEHASREIQEKWKYVGLNLMEKVNTAWKAKATRRQKLLSEVVSVSDECIVGWYFHSYLGEWKDRYEEIQKSLEEGQAIPSKKGKKQSGKGHASKKELAEFFRSVVWMEHLYQEEDKKKDLITWDEALQTMERKEYEETMRGKRSKSDLEKKGKKQKKPVNWYDGTPDFDGTMISYGNITRTVD